MRATVSKALVIGDRLEGLGDRREIPEGIETRALGEEPVHHQRARRGEHDGVAVGRGARHAFRADRAARAALRLDHDRLAERSGQALCHQPRHDVRATGHGHD